MKTKIDFMIVIVLIQIYLLINFSVAGVYFVGQENVKNNEESYEEINEFGKSILNLIINFLIIEEFGTVSAIETGCCEKTIEGAWCMDALTEECDSDYRNSPSSCEDTSYCEKGYCFDRTTGFCSANSPREKCLQGNGDWFLEDNSNLCEQGCCYLDRNTGFMTERRCEILSNLYGLEMNFDFGATERECIFLSLNEGACVYGENEDCNFITERECATRRGNFHEGEFCSEYVESFKSHDYARCVDGKEDVYWFDSEGNREDVEEDCVFLEEGCENGKCKNWNCTDENGNERKNGEEWCIYEGYVGDGKDLVGTEHFKATCIKGEVVIESSKSGYRSEICAETILEGSDKSFAELRTNLWFMCFNYETQEECEINPDCKYLGVDIDEGFQFSACVPKYPKGFDVNSEDEERSGEAICSLGTLSCTQIWKRGLFSWSCKKNCDCTKPEFALKMNDFCTSLGDCGTYINYAGERTENIFIEGDEDEIDWDSREEGEYYVVNSYFEKENAENNTPTYFGLNNRREGSYSDDFAFLDENISSEYRTNLDDWVGAIGIGGTTVSAALLTLAITQIWNPIGWVALIAVTILSIFDIVLSWIGLGKTREKIVTFNCEPWKPPLGADNCHLCNEDPLLPCTDYRCESLGSSCAIAEETRNTDNPLCENAFETDLDLPVISLKEVEGNYRINPIEGGVEVKDSQNACVRKYTQVNLTVETDELTRCKWDEDRIHNYEDMRNYFLEDNFNLEHSLENLILDKDENFDLNIICADRAGHESNFLVRFCISEIPDEQPPVILNFNPANGSYLRINETEKLVNIHLNEPSECVWSFLENQEFSTMNPTLCDPERFICSAPIQNLTEEENYIYFKCMDGLNNTHENDKKYVLIRTREELAIDSVEPSGTIREEDFTLEVETSGGAFDGRAICGWRILGTNYRDTFTETNSTNHNYNFQNLEEGVKNFEITCSDDIGNNAVKNVSINVEVDRVAPIVVRTYRDESSGKLVVITNEDAECAYSKERCSFDFENATDMTTGLRTEHFANWIAGQNYYIKCRDAWNNLNRDCAIVVQAY